MSLAQLSYNCTAAYYACRQPGSLLASGSDQHRPLAGLCVPRLLLRFLPLTLLLLLFLTLNPGSVSALQMCMAVLPSSPPVLSEEFCYLFSLQMFFSGPQVLLGFLVLLPFWVESILHMGGKLLKPCTTENFILISPLRDDLAGYGILVWK